MDWSKIDALIVPEKPPEGSFSAADYAARYKVCPSQARANIRDFLSAGKLKKTMVKVERNWVPYYTAVESTQEATREHSRRGSNGRRPNRRRTVLPVG